MNKQIIGSIITICAWICTGCAQNIKLAKVFNDAEKQTELMLQEIPKATKTSDDQFSPRTLHNGGQLRLVASRDWTSGFFPGVLWFLHEYTGKDQWKSQAQTFTAKMEREKTNGVTHDMGFKIYCSYGTGNRYRLRFCSRLIDDDIRSCCIHTIFHKNIIARIRIINCCL